MSPRRFLSLLTAAGLTWSGAGAQAQSLAVAKPEAVKLTAAGLARLDSAMNAYVSSGKLPGIVVAVARNGRLAHWKAYGYRVLEQKDPMERDDLFRIYSMTKPITCAALLVLVDEGKVALTDPVSKYIPAFAGLKVWSKDGPVAPRRPMTVKDLLQHTSGFTYGMFGETPVDSAYRKANLMAPGQTMDQLLEQLAALPLVGHPGEVWNYGFSTDVAGRVIELASGMPLDRFFAERIFGPLKMKDTFFEVPAEKRSRLTGYYAKSPGGLLLVDSPDTGSFTRRPAMFSGGGGLVSTVPDYLRFAQMLLNGGELDGVRILQPATVSAMLKNQLPDRLVPIRVGQFELPGTGFGFGVSVMVKPGLDGINDFERAGWGGYANTYFWIDPHRRLAAMVFTQSFPFSEYPLDFEFKQLVYGALERP